jgi:hypothetical protein
MKYLFVIIIAISIFSCDEYDPSQENHHVLFLSVSANADNPSDFYMEDTFRIGVNADADSIYRQTIVNLKDEFDADKYNITVQLDFVEHYFSYGEVENKVHEKAIFKLGIGANDY